MEIVWKEDGGVRGEQLLHYSYIEFVKERFDALLVASEVLGRRHYCE